MSILPSVESVIAAELLDLQAHLVVVEGLVVMGEVMVSLTPEVRAEQ